MKRNENPVETTVTTCPVKKKSRFKEVFDPIGNTPKNLAKVLFFTGARRMDIFEKTSKINWFVVHLVSIVYNSQMDTLNENDRERIRELYKTRLMVIDVSHRGASRLAEYLRSLRLQRLIKYIYCADGEWTRTRWRDR